MLCWVCGRNAWGLNVRLQQSLLVAFHYEPEADHRPSFSDLHQDIKGLQALQVAADKTWKYYVAMKMFHLTVCNACHTEITCGNCVPLTCSAVILSFVFYFCLTLNPAPHILLNSNLQCHKGPLRQLLLLTFCKQHTPCFNSQCLSNGSSSNTSSTLNCSCTFHRERNSVLYRPESQLVSSPDCIGSE